MWGAQAPILLPRIGVEKSAGLESIWEPIWEPDWSRSGSRSGSRIGDEFRAPRGAGKAPILSPWEASRIELNPRRISTPPWIGQKCQTCRFRSPLGAPRIRRFRRFPEKCRFMEFEFEKCRSQIAPGAPRSPNLPISKIWRPPGRLPGSSVSLPFAKSAKPGIWIPQKCLPGALPGASNPKSASLDLPGSAPWGSWIKRNRLVPKKCLPEAKLP